MQRLARLMRAWALGCTVGCGLQRVEPVQRGVPAAPVAEPESRSKLTWPFAAESIWNQPIGAGAIYEPADLALVQGVGFQNNIFAVAREDDPEQDVISPGEGPCTGDLSLRRLQLPMDLELTPEENAWLNSLSILMPDGRTLEEFSAATRCQPDSPLYAFPFATEDVYGLGLHGGQGGSGVSSLGGTLRAEDFTGAAIRHALKLFVWGDRNLFHDAADETRCYRWPATRCDGSAGSAGPEGYHGQNPKLVQGTLLAIPPGLTVHQLGIITLAGQRFFAAMQDYGIYVVGNSASDTVLFPSSSDGRAAFEALYGHPIHIWGADQPWVSDVNRLLGALQVVDNNGPASIGGGGTGRRPLAPPISD